MFKISPSILNADFYCLKDQLDILKEFNIEYLHIDVMDGNYVNNISFAFPILESLKDKGFKFDIHLMINDPDKFIDRFMFYGDIITIHPKTSNNLDKIFQKFKDSHKKLGFALNPDEEIPLIKEYFQYIDLILIMSVFPGYGGQKFMPKTLEKARKLQEIKKRYNIMLEIDGGIDLNTLRDLNNDYEFDLIVMGSALMNKNLVNNLENIRRLI
ncbi:ribulose-phosphate 3-epimerase [bacterium]|nr:ribulose-phosphate 3-epimerase [bacterium]